MKQFVLAFACLFFLCACGSSENPIDPDMDGMVSAPELALSTDYLFTYEKAATTLSVTATDDEGIKSYHWEQVSGHQVELSGTETPQISFVTPPVDEIISLEIKITVTNIHNLSSSEVAVITVEPQPAQEVEGNWPTQGWQTAEPQDYGLDIEKLQDALEFAENSTNAWSVLVIKDGYLVSENYFKKGSRGKAYEIQSATKSFVTTLVGIAIDKGLIDGVDEPIADLMPEYFSNDLEDWRNDILLKHSLTMTWGYKWPGDYFLADPEHPLWLWKEEAERFEIALNREKIADPGTYFIYDSTSSHFLSGVITAKTGMTTLDFANEYLFEPLGIKQSDGSSVVWNRDPLGYYEGGFGLELTPRQMAKLGYLILNKGKWENRQIVSEEWVENATSPHVDVSIPGGSRGMKHYGYQWWIEEDQKYFHALGYGGQMILVAPEKDLVVVLTSQSLPPEVHDPNNTLLRGTDIWDLTDKILAAVPPFEAEEPDGAEDGDSDGVADGDTDGAEDGDDDMDGSPDGDTDGVDDGDVDGVVDGSDDGDTDGAEDGDDDIIDSDNDGVEDLSDNCPLNENSDQQDSDDDSLGDACDLCPYDATNQCMDSPVSEFAEKLSIISGCETYVGDHPVAPGQGFVQTYQFCADGTVTKMWNPDPVENPTMPGDIVCEGTWSYDGNQLTIETKSTIMFMDLITVEKYGVAFTYQDGEKLDFYSVKQDAPGDGSSIVGSYSSSANTTVTLGTWMDSDTAAATSTVITRSGDQAVWLTTKTVETVCEGGLCPADEAIAPIETSGNIAMPGTLFELDGTFFFQEAETLVLERQ